MKSLMKTFVLTGVIGFVAMGILFGTGVLYFTEEKTVTVDEVVDLKIGGYQMIKDGKRVGYFDEDGKYHNIELEEQDSEWV